jgi:predicted acyl esterase
LRRPAALLLVLALAFVSASAARAFTKTDGAIVMDDGVSVGTTLYLPDGTPPAAGWPAILMLHGLGGSRQDMNLLAEGAYVARGYAVLTVDARGHGQSGGVVTIDGPREIADIRAAFDYLAAQPGIDRAHIGGWGVSYGGGATWLATVAGVPFAAIETFETWTDLYAALVPNNLSKSGVVFGFLNEIPLGAVSALVQSVRNDLLQSTNLAAVRALTAERSTIQALDRVTTPAFMFQGRRDFAFDMAQMTRAFTRLKGPKRLYLGNLGHPPSTFLSDDFNYFIVESQLWYDRFLKGQPNGIDTRPPVEVAPNPFKGKTVSYAGLPPTKALTASFPGRATIDQNGKVVRTVMLPKSLLEQFGAPTVKVTASSPTQYPHLVAVVSALTPKGEVILSDGGIQTTLSPKPRTIAFRLDSDATPIPAGSRLRLTLASASTAQNPNNLVYLQTPLPEGSRIAIGKVTVTLPVLKNAISK